MTTHEIDPNIVAKAKGLYMTLIGLTDTPIEAIQIIKIMHILLWINGRSSVCSTDTMLKEYAEDFKENLRINGEIESLEQ